LATVCYGQTQSIAGTFTNGVEMPKLVVTFNTDSIEKTLSINNSVDKMNKLKFIKDEGSEFYKELNEKILYEILFQNNIKPNQTSYWGGLVSHLRLLRRMSYAEKKNAL
jgi:hypothetical protein